MIEARSLGTRQALLGPYLIVPRQGSGSPVAARGSLESSLTSRQLLELQQQECPGKRNNAPTIRLLRASTCLVSILPFPIPPSLPSLPQSLANFHAQAKTNKSNAHPEFSPSPFHTTRPSPRLIAQSFRNRSQSSSKMFTPTLSRRSTYYDATARLRSARMRKPIVLRK